MEFKRERAFERTPDQEVAKEVKKTVTALPPAEGITAPAERPPVQDPGLTALGLDLAELPARQEAPSPGKEWCSNLTDDGVLNVASQMDGNSILTIPVTMEGETFNLSIQDDLSARTIEAVKGLVPRIVQGEMGPWMGAYNLGRVTGSVDAAVNDAVVLAFIDMDDNDLLDDPEVMRQAKSVLKRLPYHDLAPGLLEALEER